MLGVLFQRRCFPLLTAHSVCVWAALFQVLLLHTYSTLFLFFPDSIVATQPDKWLIAPPPPQKKKTIKKTDIRGLALCLQPPAKNAKIDNLVYSHQSGGGETSGWEVMSLTGERNQISETFLASQKPISKRNKSCFLLTHTLKVGAGERSKLMNGGKKIFLDFVPLQPSHSVYISKETKYNKP